VTARYRSTAYGSQRRSSEIRVGLPGQTADAPVLDVSFGELMCRAPEEMFAGEFALWGYQRDDVLELVAEAVAPPAW